MSTKLSHRFSEEQKVDLSNRLGKLIDQIKEIVFDQDLGCCRSLILLETTIFLLLSSGRDKHVELQLEVLDVVKSHFILRSQGINPGNTADDEYGRRLNELVSALATV